MSVDVYALKTRQTHPTSQQLRILKDDSAVFGSGYSGIN